MAGSREPGPVCQEGGARVLDEGLMCLARVAAPGPAGSQSADAESLVTEALIALQAEAEIFAWRFLNDAAARSAYVQRIKAVSDQVLRDIRLGVVGAEQGAAFASEMRNVIMEETRLATSAIGRAGAEATKAAGLTLDQALEKAVKKLFPDKTFAKLSTQQKRQVFVEVVEGSGRSSPRFTSRVPRWTRIGRGLVVVTVGISVVNIWMAENKVKQGIQEGATLLGGALGGAAATASAGFVCGPGAPVCVTVLFVIGGAVGALAASSAAEFALDQQVVVEWLGE